jgi:hypothetical protein
MSSDSSGRHLGSCIVALTVTVLVGGSVWAAAGISTPAFGAAAPSAGAAPAQLPDWAGLWEPVFDPTTFDPKTFTNLTVFPLTPNYAAKLRAYKAAHQEASMTSCIPPGMPTIMLQPYPIEFLFTPGKVTIAIETFSQMRRIFTDGRAHPADPDPTFNGHSIGHWEGDTLVVDTVGFVTSTPLNFDGSEHSDRMHIEERMHLVNPDRLAISMAIDDSKALTKPMTQVTTYGRHRDWDITEYVCEQNNRNLINSKGLPGIDLAPHDGKK